jgi:hypothetical protein
MTFRRAQAFTLTLLIVAIFAAPSGVRALSADGFAYTVVGSAATVTGCTSTCPTNLVIPATLGGNPVTAIGRYAFHINNLSTVTISDSVTSIEERAFSQNQLTSVTIPTSVTSIGLHAFSFNYLTSVTIPNSVTTIGNYAFGSNLLTNVTIPTSVTSISEGAFSWNQLTTITIPTSVTRIGDAAFWRNQLTSVTIPNSVTNIGSNAFFLNLLTSVTIPASVKFIDPYAFKDNELARITFMGNAPGNADGSLFDGNPGLTSVARFAAATGWRATYGGKRVVIATRAAATIKPTITGTSRIGQTLTAKKGTWRGTPAPTYRYQWYACTKAVTATRTTSPSTCTAIAGATRSTFRLTVAQRNNYVAVLVTGTSLGTTATTWLSKTTAKVK